MHGKAEALRDRVFQPLADEVHRIFGINCFTTARYLIRAGSLGVCAFVTADVASSPRLLTTVFGWLALLVMLNIGRQLLNLDRDIRAQERRVEGADGRTRLVWPRFRNATRGCMVQALWLWSWFVVVCLMPLQEDVTLLVLHRVVDVIAYLGGGIAAMLLTCEARTPPPRYEARLASGLA